MTQPRLEDLQERVAELERQVYVPGLWRCAKCDFRLVQANLNAGDGTVTARDEPESCPNCNVPLWRVTERQAGNELVDRCDELTKQRTAAQAEISRLAHLVNLLRDDLKRFLGADDCRICDGCGAPIDHDEDPATASDVEGCWGYVADIEGTACYRYRTRKGAERSWPPCAPLEGPPEKTE